MKEAVKRAGIDKKEVNKVCGSALKTVMLTARAIQTGDAEVVALVVKR